MKRLAIRLAGLVNSTPFDRHRGGGHPPTPSCQRTSTGGKIEPGESPKDALRRELVEELGIDAEIGGEVWRTEHQYPGHPLVQLLFFSVRRYSGTPENRVFQRILWASLSDLTLFDFLEADRPLVERLRSGELELPTGDLPESR